MSESTVRLVGAGKRYRIHASLGERFLDAVGLATRLPGYRPRWTEFWALRGIDLELASGRRIGVIGRNGAGKSTLLRLITGHLRPTEGSVEVEGPTLSLNDPAGGAHPELTGADNVRAVLTYRGLSSREIERAMVEIADFAELGEFFDRPLATYSAGMKARLAFAAATSLVAPRVLVIDEVLGAGDAYFIAKSAERMAALVASGATIVLVSHSLEQVTRICEEVLWLDRGRVVARGPCLDVVKAYQQFMNVLEDRRLRDRNRRATTASAPRELRCRFGLEGGAGAAADVAEVTLVAGEREEPLRVGEAQDTAVDQDGRVVQEGSAWSEAGSGPGGRFRSLEADAAGGSASGLVVFRLDAEECRRDHALEVRYRLRGGGRLRLQAEADDDVIARWELASEGAGWTRKRLPLGPLTAAVAGQVQTGYVEAGGKPLSRWPGEGSLRIGAVRFLGPDGRERALFEAGSRLELELTVVARDGGEIEWRPAAVLYRRDDGLLVSRYVGEPRLAALAAGGTLRTSLVLDPLRLGNGRYVVSLSLYGRLDLHALEEALVYDLVDRSYEFAVTGTPPLLDGVFVPEERWRVAGP